MKPTTRLFGLADLLILIAAIAVATTILREVAIGVTTEPGAMYWRFTPYRLLVATTLTTCATPLTLACLAFRVRKPRPLWRRAAIQPGASAMIVCVVVFAIQAVEVGASAYWPDVASLGGWEYAKSIPVRFRNSEYLVLMKSIRTNGVLGHIGPISCHATLVTSSAPPCGAAVAGVWVVLALAGRWKAERWWIDRLGRLLGISWIVISLVTAIPL